MEKEELRPLTTLENDILEVVMQHENEEKSYRKKLLKLIPHQIISLEELKEIIIIEYHGVQMKWDSIDELVNTIYCQDILEETSYRWILFEGFDGNYLYKIRKEKEKEV